MLQALMKLGTVYLFYLVDRSQPAQFVQGVSNEIYSSSLLDLAELFIGRYFDKYRKYADGSSEQSITVYFRQLFPKIASTILKTLTRGTPFGYLLPKIEYINEDDIPSITIKLLSAVIFDITVNHDAHDRPVNLEIILATRMRNQLRHPVNSVYRFVAAAFFYTDDELIMELRTHTVDRLTGFAIAANVWDIDKAAQVAYVPLAYAYAINYLARLQTDKALHLYARHHVFNADGELITDFRQIQNAWINNWADYEFQKLCGFRAITLKALETVIKQLTEDSSEQDKDKLLPVLRAIRYQLSDVSYCIYHRISAISLNIRDSLTAYSFWRVSSANRNKLLHMIETQLKINVRISVCSRKILHKLVKHLTDITNIMLFIVQDNTTKQVYIVTFDELLELIERLIANDVCISVLVFPIDKAKLAQANQTELFDWFVEEIKEQFVIIANESRKPASERFNRIAEQYVALAKRVARSDLDSGLKIALLNWMLWDLAEKPRSTIRSLQFEYNSIYDFYRLSEELGYDEIISFVLLILDYDKLVKQVERTFKQWLVE